MKRQLGYLFAAAVAIAVTIGLLLPNDDDAAVVEPAHGPIEGVYRIAQARVGPPGAAVEQPDLVGRAFIVRRDGPELVAGLCPDEAVCRGWLDQPGFRRALPSLPLETVLADAEPEAVLSSAHVVGTTTTATTTTADGRCRRRIDRGRLETTEIGVRLHRELAQTELVEDCEAQRATDRIVVELALMRLDVP